jgi:hypothetical protein
MLHFGIDRHMTCKLFDDWKDICKVHKSVEGMTIKLGVFEAFDKKVGLQARLVVPLLNSKSRPYY